MGGREGEGWAVGWVGGGVGGRWGGWTGGGGRAVGAGEEPKAGHTIHKETDSSSVSPVGHRNSHSRHGRPRPVVGSRLTHHAALLVPPSGPMHPVVDRRGLAVWEKDRL